MKTQMLPHLYQTVAEAAIFAIVVFDDNGNCLFANKSAEQLIGSAEPALTDLIPVAGKPSFKSFSPDLLKHNGRYHDILVNKKPVGSFIANIGIRHVQVDGVSSYLVMLADVTLEKKLQREIT